MVTFSNGQWFPVEYRRNASTTTTNYLIGFKCKRQFAQVHSLTVTVNCSENF